MEIAAVIFGVTVVFGAGGTYWKVWDTSRRLDKHMESEAKRDVRIDRWMLRIAEKLGVNLDE
jgi:hypothetical protein